MTYFADLSAYAYGPRVGPEALSVGWLDADHEFETAAPSEELLDALWHFIKTAPIVQSRGVHPCELCPRDPDFVDRLRSFQERMVRDPANPALRGPLGQIAWPEDARSRSVRARRGDEELTIGTAEIRVFGERTYAAPTLIYHYVLAHHYKPPNDFIRGLLHGPRPPSDEYRALLGATPDWL